MKRSYQKINDRSGFTIVETMISLMIFSISLMTIIMILQGLRHEFNDDSATEFYLYLNVIETHGYKLKNNYPRRLILERDHKIYNVKFAKDKLIMSTDKGGYIPILNNVRSIKWNRDQRSLESHVEMMNGDQFKGRSWLNEK